MSEPIKMPQLGESVTEGTISHWLKAEGDEVALDEPIVEIDTDKVSSELPSPLEGRLEKILVSEGETVDVGVEIARVAPADETVSPNDGASPAMEETSSESPTEEFPAAGTAAQPVASGAGESPSVAARDVSGGNGRAANASAVNASAKTAEELRLTRSSPIVRRLAAEHGVDLAEVSGTGTGGRVTKKDIVAFVERREEFIPPTLREEREYFAPPEAPEAAPPKAPTAPTAGPVRERVEVHEGDEVMPLTSIRRTIAGRMSQSKREAPHAWTMVECDVSGLVKLREANKETFKQREGVSLTYLPFIIEAVVASLKEYPVVNSVWSEEGIVLKKHLNIGVAVDLEEGALIVPVIKDADDYGIVGLARRSNEVIKKARSRQLAPDDLAGGTFTVNNPGALGSVVSVPIINHPQAAILSAEAIVKRPVVIENDAIAVRSMMNLEVSFDHRIFDGGIALRFLGAVKKRLEGYTAESGIS